MMRYPVLVALCCVVWSCAADIRVECPPKTMRPGALERVDSFAMESKDGLLLRNGKPFFWVGNGTEFAAIQSGPVAMWLAWIHGYSALSLYPGNPLLAKKNDRGDILLSAEVVHGHVSWFREAVRLGFLVDFFANAPYRDGKGPVGELTSASAELKEIHYDLGHYLSIDTGTSIGREWVLARRAATAQYFNELPGTFYFELCREPGPNPFNARVKRGFSDWAKRKYGTLAEANRVWRMDYANWDEVMPLHLDEKRFNYTGWVAARMRRLAAKREHPEMHYDWISYLQEDMAKSVKDEFADLRRAFPGMPVSIDQRAHASYNDAYASYDPEMFADDEDVFSLHYGWHPYVYSDQSYDRKSLLDSSAFPLFSMNYFRNLSSHPLINAEDIVSVARAPSGGAEVMRKNDLAQLHASPWKFSLDEKGCGAKQKWYERSFDDSAWGEMSVPGCWDETKAYSGKSCFAWYRKRFRVSSAYRADYEDGSRRFLIYGKGVAQKGILWVNGQKVGEVRGWDCNYSFDVGSLLNWSGENVIAWCVDGRSGSQNGLRFYCHLLAHDMISKSVTVGEKQYRQMLFEQMMRGLSGIMLWSWHSDYLRPYMPDLFAKLQTAAQVALPAVRNYRSRVAMLYAYKANLGLPCPSDGAESVDGHIDMVDAIEFSGIRPDIFGEEGFRGKVTPTDYPLLVVNRAPIVEEETYGKFRDYVRAGGVALVSKGSLAKTYRRYEATDVETFDRGRGKVVFFDPELTVEPLMDLLKPYLPRPDFTIAAERTDERPLVERLLVRNGDRAALYFCNWGGRDQSFRYELPHEYADWTLTPVTGNFCGKDRVTVDSQDVAFAILSSQGAAPVQSAKVSPRRKKIFEKVLALNCHQPAKTADTLFPLYDEPLDQKAMGVESFPYLLDRVESFGMTHAASEPLTWTAETLKGKKLVVLSEAWLCNLRDNGVLNPKARDGFFGLIEDYVRGGGSLFLIADSAKTCNVYALFLTTLAPRFGVDLGKEGLEREFVRTAFGDPCQGYLKPNLPFPLLEGVGETLCYAHTPLMGGKRCRDKVGPFAAVEFGKGRAFFSSDILAFQPFRIEHGDNAALLENAIGWLLRKNVTQAMRDGFKENLFLTEADLKVIASEER